MSPEKPKMYNKHQTKFDDGGQQEFEHLKFRLRANTPKQVKITE